MGWIENQIEERQNADQQLLDDSFGKVSEAVLGKWRARRAADGKNLVKAVNVAIVNEDGSYYDGKIILMLEVEDLETGETVYALHRRNGELELLKGYVWKDYAVFATDGLSSEEESCIAIVDEAGLNELGLKPEEAADNGLTYDGKDFGILGGEFLDYLVQQLVEFRNETETAA